MEREYSLDHSRVYSEVKSTIGYQFDSNSLLLDAFIHPSFNLDKNNNNFERLEFLGDRVLGLVIADFLFDKFSEESEGDLALRLSELVSGKKVLEISNKLDLKKIILLTNGNRSKAVNDGILIDTLEALIGAIFIDGGLIKTKKFILDNWKKLALNYKTPPKDSKSLLQEWAMANNFNMPIYEKYKKKGPDHSPIFFVKVKIENFGGATGEGSSKKIAEMNAADFLYKKI
ncbi:MAG: Ribonuclease 3 [Alphaproteobacteria bacterium MarineAlpha9_Bin2]|nr:MAG: Ribonuclease 3 [Alphaproteobacteria bacterium MarineAlpha9_Bin2]